MHAFENRSDAGRLLAQKLFQYAGRDDVIVLALPRGGVPVAFEVAQALGAPLDVFVVRKLGLPAQPELAMGAVASGGLRVLNEDVLRDAAVPAAVLEEVTIRERARVEALERLYRGDLPSLELADRDVVLVDDGLATGASMRAALAAIGARPSCRVLAAVPVAPAATVASLRGSGIELVCVLAPDSFASVGEWYRNFAATTDDEVVSLLKRYR